MSDSYQAPDCGCGHPKAEHLQRTHDCQVEGCPCPLYFLRPTTPPLDEFLPRYKADDNEWWNLSTGDMQNLFDEAVERIELLERSVDGSTP